MANYKANKFPIITISVDGMVVGYDAMAKAHNLSESNFATEIAVGPDGTLWAVSTQPDEQEGGSKIYWSDGNGKWTEIAEDAPGGYKITGCENGSCVYITNEFELYAIDEQKQSTKLAENVYGVDYGNGYYWALIPPKPGEEPVVHYSRAGANLEWQIFKGNIQASSLSSAGTVCTLLIDEIPSILNLKDLSNKPMFPGITQTAMQISSKSTTNAIVSYEVSEEGNQVLVLSASPSEQEAYRPIGNIRASRVTTSYFIPV